MSSTRRRATVVLAVVALAVSACSSRQRFAAEEPRWAAPVSVTEIVKLSQAGVPPDVIVYKVNYSGLVYYLNEEQYDSLRELGVTPKVIDYMQDTYDQALEAHPNLAKDEYLACWYLGWDGFWYGGGPWGFHPDC